MGNDLHRREKAESVLAQGPILDTKDLLANAHSMQTRRLN